METERKGNGTGGRAAQLLAWATDLEALTPREREKRVQASVAELDGARIAEAVNAWSTAVLTVTREQPELAARVAPAVREAIARTDMGRVREALERIAAEGTDVAVEALDPLVGDPVAMANLFALLSPLANAVLRTFAEALARVDLPPEMTASAMFNALTAIDAERLGELLTSAASLIEQAHVGNLLLGNDEPRLRAVLTDFAHRTLSAADTDTLAAAAVALGEDLETALAVAADVARSDPALAATIAAAWIAVATSMLKGAAGAVEALSELPDEKVAELAAHVRETIRPVEAARLVSSLASLLDRIWAAEPDLPQRVVADVTGALDTEALSSAATRFARSASQAAPVREAMEPEAIGRRINGALAAFNRRMESADGDFMKRTFGGIDPEELEKAIANAGRAITGALFASARRVKAVARGILATVWHAKKTAAKALWRRATGRGE